jgi:hypothetical protein
MGKEFLNDFLSPQRLPFRGRCQNTPLGLASAESMAHNTDKSFSPELHSLEELPMHSLPFSYYLLPS